jgi:hypothetical protein
MAYRFNPFTNQLDFYQEDTQFVSSGAIANLTSGQQDAIREGSIVTTTDGRRWVYSGTGSKTAEASYVELADITPEWSAIANKPAIPTAAPAAGQIMAGNAGGTAFATVSVSGDATLDNTGALTIANNAITNAKLANNSVTSAKIANGTITNDDIFATAAIGDTKINTISSAGKVANSATTATSANTASAIVARDASGNFSAGTITANLTGTASGNAPATGIFPSAITGTAVITTDARLSDSRTPTAHKASHSTGGTDALSPADIGAAAASHTHAASDITSGTFGISLIPTGTTSTTVAIGDHTHTQLHDRSHAITSTSDHTAGTHKVFYSNGSGEIVELPLGSSGQVLTSNGTSSAPSFATASGGITAIGTSAADALSISGSDLVADDPGADRILFWDDSESKLTHLEVGSGLTLSGTTLTAGAGGTKTYAAFNAQDNQPPATNFATLDTRNSIAILDFDDATDESAIFLGIIPEAASLGSGLKIRLIWTAATATSGACVWDASLERMTTDIDTDSFDTAASVTTTTNGTSGVPNYSEITLTTIDSVTAGDGFRLKINRDANNGSDTMTGDAELIAVEVRSAA